MGNNNKENKATFSDLLRAKFKNIIVFGASSLLKLGLTPNTVTYFGLVGHIIAAYFVARGMITQGGLVLLLMAPLDFLDGTMARLQGKATKLGSFIDSVTDRTAEFVIYGGLLIYYLQQQNDLGCILVYLAVAGSILVSYIRAKAESLQLEAKQGFLSRVERYIVLIPCLIINIPLVALWIIAILANLTVIQRFIYVSQQARKEASLEDAQS